MGNFNIDLNINTESVVTSSKSGMYEEIVNTSKIVDNTDAGTVLLTGASSLGSTNSIKSAKGLMIKNSGLVGAEILVKLDTWADASADTNATDAPTYLSHMLSSGDFIFLPNLRQVGFSSTNSAANGSVMDNVDASQLAGTNNVLKKAGASGATLGGHIDGTTTDITVSDSDFFKVGDLIQLGTYEGGGNNDSIEIMKVTSIDDATGITVERALYGSNLGNQGGTQTVGHASGAIVYLPFFNIYNDQAKYTSPRINSGGSYWAKNLLGYGRTASEGDGFVAGSISGKFYYGGYQEVGLSGLSASSDTRLVKGDTYLIKVNPNDTGLVDVSFTVSSSNSTLGGSDGVIQKIQDALDALTNATSGTMSGINVKVEIVNGDIRFTSVERSSSSSIVLAKGGTGTGHIGHAVHGIFPLIADFQQAVGAYLPDDIIYDRRTYASKPNINDMFYDDGFGNIKGACTGVINYETGEISLDNAPNDCDFVVSANYSSAHAGGNEYDTELGNSILEIKGRSLNSKINTTLDVMVVR